MDDFIQDDLHVNLNSAVQVLADVTTDYLVMNQVLTRITGTDLQANMLTSTVYHIADEIVFPAIMDSAGDIIERFPLIGGWLKNMLDNIKRQEYVKVILRIIVIATLQKMFENKIDFIEGAVMFVSTYAINFAVEVETIKEVLDWEIDF